jgi:hypothetical protein
MKSEDSMLTKEQAEAASQTLLSEPRLAQDARAAELSAKREKRRFPPIKWLAVGAILGLFAGGLVGYYFTGTTSPWSIFGLSAGMIVGIALDSRRGA